MALSSGIHAAPPFEAAQYQRDLTRISQTIFGLDAPVSTLAAQIQQESAFRPMAKSWAGASGLAQMMPATAASLARLYPDLHPVNVFDPRWSLMAQSYLMKELGIRHKAAFDCIERLSFSLASYNQGPVWTDKQISKSTMPKFWLGATEFVLVGKRESAVKETTNYVRRIMLWLRPTYISAGWGDGGCY